MNKATTIWQRMGALLLALVLVVGLVPVDAMAAWEIRDASRLSVQLTRTNNGGKYEYEVTFVTNNVGANDAKYYWCNDVSKVDNDLDDEEIYTAYRSGKGTEDSPYTFDTTHSTHTSSSEKAGVKVVVDGLWVKASIPATYTEDEYGVARATATWATKSTLPSVQVGVPFSMTYEYMCSEAQTTGADGAYLFCGVEEDDAAPTFEDDFGADVQKLADGRYLLKKEPAGNLTLERTVRSGRSSLKRGWEVLSAAVKAVEFKDVKFNGKEAVENGTTYVKDENITLSVKCGVEDAAYMPNLGEDITWTLADGIWSAEVEENTYTIGGIDYEAAVDSAAMEFDGIPTAYVDGEKTYVQYALKSEPVSGIDTVTLGGKTVTAGVVNEALSGTQTLKVTNGAGTSVSTDVAVTKALEVSVAADGFVNANNYTSTSNLKVTTNRAGKLTIDGTEITIDTASYTIEDGVEAYSGKSWIFTDDLGRTATGNVEAYVVDKDIPEITISANSKALTGLTGYAAEETTIVVSVSDAGSGVNLAKSWVKYTLNGEEKEAQIQEGKATIVLTNEQNLQKLTVYAEDNLSLPNKKELSGSLTVDTVKPEMTLSIFAETNGTENKASGIYEKDGNNWLILESAVTGQEKVATTIGIHAVVTDNLGMANMDGWTSNGEAWEIDITAATVDNHKEEEITLSVPVVKDNAGNSPDFLTLPIGDSQSLELTKNTAGTHYEVKVNVDRRYPDDGNNKEIPEVTFSTAATPKATLSEDVKLYNEDSLTFTATVVDNGSGVAAGTYKFVLDDRDGKIKFLKGASYASNPTSITVTAAGKGEDNALVLKLTVGDNVGNSWTYSHTFAFDNKAPRVTIGLGDTEYRHKDGGAYYFNEDVTATVTVDELNFVAKKTVVNELNFDAKNPVVDENGDSLTMNGQSCTVKFTSDGEKTLMASSEDLAGNASGNKTADIGESFILDKTKPTILVTQTTNSNDVNNDGGSIYYYNGKEVYEQEGVVTFSFQIADAHLTDDGGSAEIKYTINDVDTVLYLGDLKPNADETVYTHSFELKDGQRLTALSIDAVDNAGNPFELNSASNVEFKDGVYSGPQIVVDTTPPVVTITAATTTKDKAAPVNTVDTVDLYNEEVTYTIKVEDANLDYKSTGAKYNVTYTYKDAAGEEHTVTVNKTSDAWVRNHDVNDDKTDVYEYKFTLTDGQRFTGATVEIADAAANAPVEAGSTEWGIAGGTITYKDESHDIVVDTTAPKAELSFKCNTDGVNLEKYYTNGGVAYLKISTPTTSEALKDKKLPETVAVTATVTITDNNLSTKKIDDTLFIEDLTKDPTKDPTKAWTLVDEEYTAINTDKAKVTYTQELSVPINDTKGVDMNFLIRDLARNDLIKEDVSVAPINGTVLKTEENKSEDTSFITVDAGTLTGAITLDRRQPTTVNPDTPKIVLTTEATPKAYLNGIPLYNETALTFNLQVNDGEKDKENAGLKSVIWEVEAESFITPDTTTAKTEYDNKHELSYNKDIFMDIAKGEQNNVAINVTAVDNVANQIYYQHPIAVDTLAPKVTVTCDNDDVRNEDVSGKDGYFNRDRVFTIEVEDINFDAEKTKVETKGGYMSGWKHDGSKHTATVSYTEDGTYSLSMTVVDLAGNTTKDAQVDYSAVKAPKNFVIDKTAPEIYVHYDPADPSGTHNNVLFYDEIQTVTVTIEELNFHVQGLETEFTQEGTPSTHRLSDFNEDGDNHNAHVTFENGNLYQFDIDFEDLAGNRAEGYESPTFSVDTHAPEIEILSANVSQEYLQPLAEDLELVLQVTDNETNLSECRLELTHVNNAFEKMVVSGDVYYTRSTTNEEYRVTFSFKDFPYEKLYDGIYTVELYAKDYAGNDVSLTPPIQFSMNRFGSTFIYGNEFTETFLTPGDDGVAYRNKIDNSLVIQEINPNRVFTDETQKTEGSSLTMVVNGQSTLLVQGRDYKLTIEERGEKGTSWYVYTYEIYRDVFEDGNDLVNGRYSIVLYGVDEAGNSNTNTLETVNGDEAYTAKIEFVLDTIAPVIITTGIENGEIYDATSKQMEIEIADSTPSTIQVYLNDQLVSLSQNSEELPEDSIWLVQDELTGIYTLNVTEQNALFSSQSVKIQALDAADNEAEAEVKNFTITTNWFVRYVNSGWLMITLASLAAAAVLIIFIGKKKKKAAV